jgi:hypothetical protein
MLRSIRVKELKQLSTSGGRGGHLSVRCNDLSWVFDRSMGMITPSSGGVNLDMFTNQNTNNADTDTDAVTDTDADTMDSNKVNVDSYDDSSVDSGNSSVGAVTMTGNRIVHIPSVALVISKDACCRQCTKDNFTSFLLFCEREVKSITSATKGVPKHVMDEIRKLLKQITVKAFYEKWKVLQLNDDESLTITEETHGLATNLFLTGKKNIRVL